MKSALPQEKYQYFFEGEYPSTNGLSGKWISEIRIYSGGIPANEGMLAAPDAHESGSPVPWPPLVLGSAGIALVGLYFYMRKKTK